MTETTQDTLKADLEAIQSLAEQQLGDWLGVSAVYQPADMHHWQEVHDLAFGAQETAYRLRKELEALKRQNRRARKLLGSCWSLLQYVLSGHFPRPEIERTVNELEAMNAELSTGRDEMEQVE